MANVVVTKSGRRYDIAALRDAIQRAKTNIATYEAAIQDQRRIIADYRELIKEEEKRQATPVVIEIDE